MKICCSSAHTIVRIYRESLTLAYPYFMVYRIFKHRVISVAIADK